MPDHRTHRRSDHSQRQLSFRCFSASRRLRSPGALCFCFEEWEADAVFCLSPQRLFFGKFSIKGRVHLPVFTTIPSQQETYLHALHSPRRIAADENRTSFMKNQEFFPVNVSRFPSSKNFLPLFGKNALLQLIRPASSHFITALHVPPPPFVQGASKNRLRLPAKIAYARRLFPLPVPTFDFSPR